MELKLPENLKNIPATLKGLGQKDLGRGGKKSEDVYPSKTTLNLAQKEENSLLSKRTLALWGIAAAVLFVVLVTAIVNPLLDRREARQELSATQEQADALTEKMRDYDEVESRYACYATNWMSDEERALVDREDLFSMVNDVLMDEGDVLAYTITDNLLTVQLSGLSLEDVSRLVDTLYKLDNVENVSLYTADKEEEASEDKTTIQDTISLIITMRDQVEIKEAS